MDSPVLLMHHDPDRSWITDPDPDHPKGTHLFVMFVTTVCFLFVLKLKWPKNKNVYDIIIIVIIVSITKFSIVIGVPRAYFSRNWCPI